MIPFRVMALLIIALATFSCGSSEELIDEICEEIVGKRFESRDEQVCWGDPIIYCHWCVSFDEKNYAWMPGDAGMIREYTCSNGEIADKHEPSWPTGKYDPESGELTWDGVIYLLADFQRTCVDL